eukprot:115363_1
MEFFNMQFGGGMWTSKEASDQMSSDMLITRLNTLCTDESIEELKIILQKEETAKCLHDALPDFTALSKRFSVGFNYSMRNSLEIYRQNYCPTTIDELTDSETFQHNPCRIFFNKINICIDCMLKIFATSPLMMVIFEHKNDKTFSYLGAVTSWLKLLYYPPLLRRIIKSEKPSDDDVEYLEMLFLTVQNWSSKKSDKRLNKRNDRDFKPQTASENENNGNDFILYDDDVVYCLVRYALIFAIGIKRKYFNRKRLENMWNVYILEQYRSDEYININYFVSNSSKLYTFCESLSSFSMKENEMKEVITLCISLIAFSIQIRYHDFFMENCLDDEEYRIVSENVNLILEHHRKRSLQCHFCHKYGLHMKLCKGCKVIYFCSRRCQKLDWKRRHRLNCTAIRKLWWRKMEACQICFLVKAF